MKSRQANVQIYIQEELSDARMRLDELKNYIVQASDFINKSGQKDHIYAVAGDIIHAIPETLLKLERALQATALACNTVDNEEIKSQIRPNKIDQLERVLDEIRVNLPRRTGKLTEFNVDED